MAVAANRPGRIRVAINALHAKSGGGVTYLRNILVHFANEPDLEFHLFLHEDQYELFASIPDNIQLHLLDFEPKLFGLLLWEQSALPMLCRMMSVDVMFSPANYGPLFAPRPVILLRNALSVAGGERRFGKRIYWAGVGLMTFLSVLRSRKAIAVSHFARRQLTFGLSRFFPSKTEVVYHGVNPMFRPARAVDEKSPFILAVSDIYVQKNLHGLVDALPAIVARFPQLRLKVAGRPIDKEYYEDVRSKAAALGVLEKIDFLGHCATDDLIDLYAGCKLLVFPSTVETFGNPLVEAMACGVPVASSNRTAMPEILEDAAVFFNPHAPAEIAAAVLEILDDPARADTLAAAGLARAADFSWERTSRKTCVIFRSAAGIHDRP